MTVQQPYVSEDLTHFVGRSEENDENRFALLKKILVEGKLQRGPTPVAGSPTIRIDPSASIAERRMYNNPDVVCFCDIPLDSMGFHMQKYGHFGIAFSKRLLAKAGASPVFYVAKGSSVLNLENWTETTRGAHFDKMVKRFHTLMDELQDSRMTTIECHMTGDPPGQLTRLRHAPSDDPVISVRHFFDSEILPFITFFDEQLGDDDPNSYYMEREWRKKGRVPFIREDVRRLIMPSVFVEPFRREMPNWEDTPIHAAENPAAPLTTNFVAPRGSPF